MKQNAYLVDLGTGSNRNLLPLGTGLISAYSQSQPELDEAFNFNLHFLRGDPADIAHSFDNPAVVGFACYVWNMRASMRVAATVKQTHPNALIVVGGYSIPKAPDRIRRFLDEHPFIDVLVHGEGEFTFADLMRAVLARSSFETVPGITYREPDAAAGFVTTARRDRIGDLNDIPSPFLNGAFDRLMRLHGPQVTGAVWETNRGCPFSCTFCDWGNADVNKVKKFDMDRLAAEIEWLSRNKIFYIYLADANFGIFYDRDLEIAGRLADQSQANGFPKFIAINWTKNSHERIVTIADRLASGGIVTSVTLAMQSFNIDTLAAIKRRNIKHDSLLRLKKEFHDRDLPTYTELILGLPGETYDSFIYGLNQAMTARLADHWVFHLCTLLENTEMESAESRQRYGIESRICSAGIARRTAAVADEPELEEIVVGTASMPTPEWRRTYKVGYLCAVLYNFRVAFFLMNYFQQEFGTDHTSFVEFVISEVEAAPGQYPVLELAVGHLVKQQQMILDGIAMLSPVDGLGGSLALPHEAVLAMVLADIDQLYGDLRLIAGRFCGSIDAPADGSLLDDLVRYQQARMPIFRAAGSELIEFHWNLPQYFDALTSGRPLPQLEPQRTAMKVTVPPTTAATAEQFAGQRTRSGHTIHLYKAEPVDLAKARVPELLS